MSGPDATEVETGSLDNFAQYVEELADHWARSTGPAMKMAKSESGGLNYPRFGAFAAGSQLEGEYEQKRSTMATSAGEVWSALYGLGQATRKVSENYTTTEAANNANVGEVQGIMMEELGGLGGGGQQPDGGGQEPFPDGS